MARLGRKPVRPGRATIAVSLGALGLFVISMAAGLGTGSGGWPIGAVGAAMVIVAVALLTTASMRGGDRSFVQGSVHVVKISDPPVIATEYGRCEMQVLVDSPGHPGQTVMIRDPRVPVEKWPEVGDTLPALIAVSDARRIKIQWERVGVYGGEYDEFDEMGEMGLYGEEPAITEPTSEYPTVQPDPLPKRKPQPVPVLEGELVPAQRQPTNGEPPLTVDALDFSDVAEAVLADDVPEPALEPEPQTRPQPKPQPQPQPQPQPVRTGGGGSVFAESTAAHVLATQPPARPATSGTIHGVGYTVQVTDLQRSQRFYHDMLGFYELDGGLDSVVLASGDTRIVLMTTQDAESVRKRLVFLNLEVGDVEAVYQELKVRGVRFTRPPRVVRQGERLEQISASFRDPDGHGIAITQWKAISPAT